MFKYLKIFYRKNTLSGKFFYSQELTEETNQFKEDFSRMRTHLNVAAKLELQTQEKMYESRLHHLENVLEGMLLNVHFIQTILYLENCI